ncbi:MAG: DUF3782 domain-containing protein [Pyrobaculum sp.]
MEELKEGLRRLVKEDRRFFRDLIIEALSEDGEELVDILLKSPRAKARLASELASVIAVPLNVATKEDVEKITQELKKFATREDVEKIASRLGDFVTKEDFEKLVSMLGQFATKEDLKQFATKEDLKQFATKEDLKMFATKEDLRQFATKEDLKIFATKEDLAREVKRLENVITALGARWGVMSEEAFREGLREILKDAGWVAVREVLRDEVGLVHGEPGDVEYDVVVKDGAVILLELTSAVKRGDVAIVDKKRELYERVKGVKVAAVYIVTPFIHDKQPEKVVEMAEKRGIKIVYPTPPNI